MKNEDLQKNVFVNRGPGSNLLRFAHSVRKYFCKKKIEKICENKYVNAYESSEPRTPEYEQEFTERERRKE